MRLFLLPFAWLYTFVIAGRNLAFQKGLLKTTRVSVPVISVGNLTVGGAGKTPLVECIVEILVRLGRHVAIISRGYGRATKGLRVVSDGSAVRLTAWEGGDEPVQMARKFPGVCVVVAERRVDAARHAIETSGVDVIVLDDGFQHRYLARDLDILVIDSRKDIRQEWMLPAGLRREPLSALRRAGLVALSRVEQPLGIQSHASNLSPWYTGPLIAYRYKVSRVCRATDDAPMGSTEIESISFFAFSGIGDHAAFLLQLGEAGLRVGADVRFPDHHPYGTADVQFLARKAGDERAFITTEKDVARLRAVPALDAAFMRRVAYAQITVEIMEGKEILASLINRCLGPKVAL